MNTMLELPEKLFRRLQQFAVPLVDTLPSVIERLADHYEATVDAVRHPVKTVVDPTYDRVKKFDPLNPPDLLHTRVEGTFGTKSFRKWNELVRLAHIEAYQKAGSFEALKAATHSQIRKGDHEGISGFHFIPDIGISVQGVDAKHAWSHALRLAQYTGKPLCLAIQWRNNEKAVYPGESGILEWLP